MEYLVNLNESQKMKAPISNHQVVKINSAVLIHEENLPRSAWKIGLAEELILGKDDCIQGTIVRVLRTKCLITKLFNKLFQVEALHNCVDVNNIKKRTMI